MKRFRTQLGTQEQLAKFFFFAFLILILVACGSSGGDGGGQGRIPYTGKTTQAKVTSGNSGKIMSEVQNFGGGLDVYDVVRRIQALVVVRASTKPVPVNGERPGSCGGQRSITGTIDDVTKDVNLTMKFDGFCEDGTTISGSIPVRGKVGALTMTITELSISGLSTSITISGRIAVEINSLGDRATLEVTDEVTMKMNVVVQENESKKTFKIENYRVDAFSGNNDTTTSRKGRFFSPDNGFVDVTTPRAIVMVSDRENPAIGRLLVTGSNGSKAHLKTINTVNFQLEVDADGDGVFESITTEPWENLANATF